MLLFFLSVLESEEDRQKFTAIYEKYHERMETAAIQILTEQKDAEDAVQNAFLQVIKHFAKTYEIPCEEIPFWLISIVKNEALMILRKRNRIVPLEDWDGFVATAEETTSYKEIVDLVRRLPETYRATLEMKILLDYTDEEVSKHLGISKTEVSTRSNRGRKLLREIMEKEGLRP